VTEGWRKLRLLFVLDHFGSGGAQRQMVLLASGLVPRGHEIEFFTYHRGFDFFRSGVLAAGCVVHAVDIREIGSRRVLSLLRRLIRSGKFDAILAFMEGPALCVELAALCTRGPPVVVSERVDLERSGGWRLDLRIALHRIADLVVTNSHTCASQLRSRYRWLAPRVRVIVNGVDTAEFAPVAPVETRPPLRLVSVGTVTPRKNPLAVVDAMQLLRSRLSVLPTMTWAGKTDTDSNSQSYRKRVEEALSAARLSENWIWAGEQGDVVRLLHRADVLVHPSLREGVANAICEALACGLPVLAGANGDTPWLLGQEERGLFIDPEHPGSIADALERMCRMSANERQAMREAARKFAVDHLGVERYTTSYERLFLGLVGVDA
jgi:glycosyltransferase involved in cell wall biosynthesis